MAILIVITSCKVRAIIIPVVAAALDNCRKRAETRITKAAAAQPYEHIQKYRAFS